MVVMVLRLLVVECTRTLSRDRGLRRCDTVTWEAPSSAAKPHHCAADPYDATPPVDATAALIASWADGRRPADM